MRQFELPDAIFELESEESPIPRRRVRALTPASHAALVLRYIRLN